MFWRFFFFVMVVVGVVLPAQTAFAHDPPAMAPTRLDFDATQAPKACNDRGTFSSILVTWVPQEVWSSDADRRLMVHLRRTPAGEKLADVTLMDAAGTTRVHEQQTFASHAECYKVLYITARTAARLLGAFDKRPPPEPCPTCPACPSCPALPTPAPLLLALPTLPKPRILPLAPPLRWAFIGVGVFLGTGISREGAVGPTGTFGFVLSPRMPRMHFEMNAAWAPQTLPKSNTAGALGVNMIPVVGSLCSSRSAFRICSGLVTTFFMAERTNLVPGNDQLRMTLGANLQLGAQFDIAGPLSIRLDVFGRLRFAERTYGYELAKLDELNAFSAGAAAMGVCSFH